MMRRWKLFLSVADIDEAASPTAANVKSFAVFLFKCRQRRSLVGRQGLGDGMGEMAQYVLAQVVFPIMGYEEWQGLSATELRAKAAPYRVGIKEEWARLRRAFPEMQSTAKPFVKDN